MSDIIETLLLRNLQKVFGEGDPARRHRGSLHRGLRPSPAHWPRCGRQALDQIAGELCAGHPTFV
jgi:hypothetical protein